MTPVLLKIHKNWFTLNVMFHKKLNPTPKTTVMLSEDLIDNKVNIFKH